MDAVNENTGSNIEKISKFYVISCVKNSIKRKIKFQIVFSEKLEIENGFLKPYILQLKSTKLYNYN